MSGAAAGIDRVAIAGCGLIGASWAAYFLAHGLDVVATDPAPGAETRLREAVEKYWPVLERIGLAEDASKERLRFEADLSIAVKDAGFVQESGPERLDIKRTLIGEIDAAAKADALIATSSSGLLASDIQDAARHPERVLVGHPFNPPHLIPLVEVVGGKLTSAAAIDLALKFYAAIGKKPIHIRKEMKGHIANRLQAALWQEAFFLVDQGVASVADIDAAIAWGPGLRWALLGPFLNLHLAGGDGGIAYLMDHLGAPIESWMRDLGEISLSEKMKTEVVRGVGAELEGRDLSAMVSRRDDVLLALLGLKAKARELP
jgi:carnitine 3-dehydrogenase